MAYLSLLPSLSRGCNPGVSQGWVLSEGLTGEGSASKTAHAVGGLHSSLAVSCHVGLCNTGAGFIKASIKGKAVPGRWKSPSM